MELHVKRFEELSASELYGILRLRVAVFVVEQCCIYQELDDLDQDALHVWLEDEDGVAAYLRVLDRGVESEHVAIGRVVTREHRRGLGSRVLREGIRVAAERLNADSIYMEAQSHARAFYERQGFRCFGEPFRLDGIPHVKMLLEEEGKTK